MFNIIYMLFQIIVYSLFIFYFIKFGLKKNVEDGILAIILYTIFENSLR